MMTIQRHTCVPRMLIHTHTHIQINTPADKEVNKLKCVSKICREKMAVIVLSCV